MQLDTELKKLFDEDDEFSCLGFKFPPEYRQNYEDGNITIEENYRNRLPIYGNSEKYLCD